MVSIPHAGEDIAEEAAWLKNQDPKTLLCDVDRFVDRLYEPTLDLLKIPTIKTPWNRYNIDCNRRPDDLDPKALRKKGVQRTSHYSYGLYWLTTTKSQPLILEPIDENVHEAIFHCCYKPFHTQVSQTIEDIKKKFGEVYHLDLHSMPSVATRVHSDSEDKRERPEVTVSDNLGASSSDFFTELVIKSYEDAGFSVILNWPYEGGGITTLYGNPQKHQHTLQIELNRKLYMDEDTKEPLKGEFENVQKKLELAVTKIYRGLSL